MRREARSAEALAERSEATWVHDPDDLVPSTLVNPFTTLFEYPDERAVESRADVPTFTTAVLDRPLTLAGRVVAHLEVGSDAPSLSLHVKLVDVYADGRAHALLFGQQVVDDPGAGSLAEVLSRPHRLPRAPRPPLAPADRLHDFPVFLPHPGTAENPWDATATRTNRQSLSTGGATPS